MEGTTSNEYECTTPFLGASLFRVNYQIVHYRPSAPTLSTKLFHFLREFCHSVFAMSKFMLAVKKAISFVAFARFKAAESSLEAKITSAIVKRGNRSRKIPKNIDAILVQFPKISRALAHIKSEFDSLGEGD